MASVPKTKAGKERKVAKTMGEFKGGDLKSSSGDTVTNPKQAVAIALNQTGQSKPKTPPRQTQTQRLAQRVDQGIDAKRPKPR